MPTGWAYWLALPLALIGSMTPFERPEFNGISI